MLPLLACTLGLILGVWGAALPAPNPLVGVQNPSTIALENLPPTTDDFGFTPDPVSVPRWPMPDTSTIWFDGSKSKLFPGINITIVGLHGSSCAESPMRNYQFLNGTRKDATYQDMVDELGLVFRSQDSSEDLLDLYLAQTAAIAWEVYQLANDTLSWLNIPDAPPEGFLPIPRGLQKQTFQSGTIDVARRADDGEIQPAPASSDTRVNVNQLDTPPRGPVRTAPGDIPEPVNPNTAIQSSEMVRSWGALGMDALITLIGASLGSAVSYGSLTIAYEAHKIAPYEWKARFFAAAGIAIGIITAVFISIIQANRRAAFNALKQKTVNAGQLAAMHQFMDEAKKELATYRSNIASGVARATPNPQQVAETLVVKPAKFLKASPQAVGTTLGTGMRRAKSSFGKVTDALLASGSGSSGPGSAASAPANLDPAAGRSAPGDAESVYPLPQLPEPRLTPEEMEAARKAPLCNIREGIQEGRDDVRVNEPGLDHPLAGASTS